MGSWEDLFSLGVATPWGGGHLKFQDLANHMITIGGNGSITHNGNWAGHWWKGAQQQDLFSLGVATPWGGGHLKFEDLFSLGVKTPWGGGHMSWEDLFSFGVATPWGGGH